MSLSYCQTKSSYLWHFILLKITVERQQELMSKRLSVALLTMIIQGQIGQDSGYTSWLVTTFLSTNHVLVLGLGIGLGLNIHPNRV